MLLHQTSETRAKLQAAKTVARLNDVYRRAMLALGFTNYALGYVPASSTGADAPLNSPFLLLNWPKGWLELYAREGFAADDVLLAEAARTSEPFTWSEVRARYPNASARIFALATEFGWGDGLVIPVHNDLGPVAEKFGVVSLAAPSLDDWSAAQRTAAIAFSLVTFARARVLTGSGPAQASLLSDRERESLALVAEGFGDAEIAAAMAIAPATAHYHVEKAKRKLGAVSRAQAIAIALTQGLI